MNVIIDKDQYAVIKIEDGEWQLLELTTGTHLTTIHHFILFDNLEDAENEMRKKYPDWGLEEEIEEIE